MAKGLDEYDEFRKKFNEKFRKITKAEVADLNDRQRKLYDEIVANENIAAVPKDKPRMKGGSVRLREFDSETFKRVRDNPLYGKIKKKPTREEIMARKRAKANEYRTNLDFPGATKGYGYPTRINPDGSTGDRVAGGMSVPVSKPRVAPKERKAHGGKVHRGRKANYNG
jgi:hypothetical protein|tara:strand:+ start:75 stop:581 length:507 start_codon:yes stop_codon:yes gene_type:complete